MGDATIEGAEPPAEKQKYDQEFFLALAANGKDEWNAWRRDPANKNVCVTFAGVDFSESPRDQIDFSGFEFGDRADFSECIWRGVPWRFGDDFESGYGFGIRFDFKGFRPGRASFIGATFGHHAFFINASFGEEAFFDGAIFEHHASFSAATFGDGASFEKTIFGPWPKFDYATFGAGANFGGATFGSHAAFRATAFGYSASFDGANFQGSVLFIGDPRPIEKYEDPENPLKQRHRRLWEHRGSGPDRFRSISFVNARFNFKVEYSGGADFSSRKFESVVDFSNARFFKLPVFDNVSNVAQIDFTGTRFDFVLPGQRHWTFDSQIPIRFRALRKIAEETKNHDLERDLYIEERKAERGVNWYKLRDERKKAFEEHRKTLEKITNQIKDIYSASERRTWERITYGFGIADIYARRSRQLLWITVMSFYWALADYGRSLWRPFLAWAALTFIAFPLLYDQILLPPPKTADAGQYEQAVQTVARANAVPFVGSLTIDADIKKILFCEKEELEKCHPIPTKYYQWVAVGQNVLSIVLVFFIGLALRNYFKIK